MHRPIVFMWNGESIADIYAWARDHDDEVVKVRHTWREPNPFAGRFEDREEIIEMPRTWANVIRYGGMNADFYAVVE